MNLKQVGNSIKIARKLKKLSQTELGVKFGIDKTYVSRLENGKVNMNMSKLLRIFNLLNIEMIVEIEDLKIKL